MVVPKANLERQNHFLSWRALGASTAQLSLHGHVIARPLYFVLVFKLLSPAPMSEFSPFMTNVIAQQTCACTFDRVVLHFYVIFEYVQQHPCPETDNNTNCIKYSLISNWFFGQAFDWEINFHFYFYLDCV